MPLLGTNRSHLIARCAQLIADNQSDKFLYLVASHPYLADTALFSSDYPHSVTLWPNSRAHAAKLTAGLSPDAAGKILAGNAARLYGL